MLPFFKTGKAVIGPLDNHVRDNAFSISYQNCKSSWMLIFLFSFQWIIAFIRKGLKLDPADSLFVYVNQAFAPAPGKWPPLSKSDQDMTLKILLCENSLIAIPHQIGRQIKSFCDFFSDQTVRNLTNCFGSEGKLSLYYSKTQAWG